MKKPKTVADLLAVTDICIKASEARAQLLDSHNKGPSKKKKKKEDQEVIAVDHGNQKQQPTEQKEKRSFHRPIDVEKWYEIHCTAWHDLQECKKFLDHKKMPKKPTTQEP
jgi:hypothetical protein